MRFATRREAGFTLMEVLAALTIFAMGVVSIISLFPITARIQSETIGDVMSQIVMRNAEVTLRTRPIPVWYLNNGGSPSTITGAFIASDASPTTVTYNNFGVVPVGTAAEILNAVAVVELPKAAGGAYGWLDDNKGIYTLRDRSYPAVSAVGSHAYTWVPLVRRKRAPSTPPGTTTAITPGELLPEEWEVFVFVLRNRTGVTPGQILNAAIKTTSDLTRFDFDGFSNAAPDIVPGQQVLMNDGTIYNVTRADSKGFHISGLVLPDSAGNYPNRVWFGARGTAQLSRIEGAEVIE